MQRFYDLNTIQKICLLIAFMSFFIILVGGTGFYFNNKNGASIDALYKNRAVPMSELNLAKSTANGIRVDIVEYILTTSPKRKNELLDDIKMRKERNNKIFSEYKKTKLNEFANVKLVEMQSNLTDWRNMQDIIIKKVDNGDKKGAYSYYLENLAVPEKLQQTLRDLSDYNKKVANETNNQTKKDVIFANLFIIGTIITAIILSLIFGCFISTRIQELLNKLVKKMDEVAKGNLKVDDFGFVSNSDVGQLCVSFDTMLNNLKKLVMEVAKSAEDISASSEEMSASAEQTAEGSQQTAISTSQLAQGAQEISRNIEDGANNISKMNKVIHGIYEDAKAVAKLGDDTETDANEGNKQVRKAVCKIDNIKNVSEDISQTIARLGSLSSEIEQIVDLIKNIASQTNLLALNAAIEAARAGEHGKGFAVVADEVKKLSGQSAEATDKITGMIKEIQSETGIAVNKMNKTTQEVSEGVSVINEAGTALENIITQMKITNSKIQGITKEIDGAAGNSEDVVKMIENISAVTEQTAASAEEISSITEEQSSNLQEISASSQVLAKIAENLQRQVAMFKI